MAFLWLRPGVIFCGVLLGGLFGILGLSGCASVTSALLEEPKVQIHSVFVRDAKADGATAVIALDVENPNRVSLTVDRLAYDLELGGRRVAQAEVDKVATLKARAVSRVEIPVSFKYTEVFSSIFEAITKGSAAYRVSGTASVGLFTLPFEHKGDLPLRR
ncbi:MAG: LEA type 2 family protein [Bdellovibrionales bacterium]|jgi:LEA14-like dessication related protein|nr:LEA type 2 family protein [Bdellovibrionales bacterium]